MPASEEIERAATLKVEGNALFAEKSYYEAIDKYTQAIGLDGENAILYSNRAACYIILDSFGPAALDALKATTFNSTYVKAWARLAIAQQGLQDYRKAVKSWTRALAVLPNDNPTPADVKQREEYEKSLQQATRLAATHGTWDLSKIDASGSMLLFNSIGKKLPGQRAKEMVSRLKARNVTRSSAFVIAEAYEGYHTGLGRLDKVSMIAVPGSSMARARGMTGVIELLTNAILQDERSCIIPSPEFQQKMNSQIKMEMVGARSPQDPRNFGMFTNEIRRLHAEGGFELSRLAFSTPVRIMLCQAFMDEAGSDHHEAAIELYDYVLKLLRWGQEEYPDVSRELRGPVLEETFINGIRGLRLTSYMKAHNMNKTSCTITLNGLLEEADSLIESVRAHPPQASEPGFNLAFGDYLEAHALAMKGYVWSHRAREAKYTDAREVQEGRVQLKTSGDFYFAAARKLPADEENHAWYFKAGLDQYYSGSAPLSITLPLLERLLSAITLSQEIWQFSQITYELQGELYEALETFDTKIRHAIKEGAFNLDAFAAPPWASPKHVFGDALEKATAGPMTYL